MSRSLNKFMGIGNLCKDPDVRNINNESKVANFTIACNESYNDKSGQKVDKTEFVRIVMWRGLADIAEKYLRKGSLVYVEGKLATRSYEDENGVKKYTTEVVANNMQMLGGKNAEPGTSGQGDSEAQGSPRETAPSQDDSEWLPF